MPEMVLGRIKKLRVWTLYFRLKNLDNLLHPHDEEVRHTYLFSYLFILNIRLATDSYFLSFLFLLKINYYKVFPSPFQI